MKVVNTPNAPKAIGPYSQGIEIDGTYYFSGQIGLNPQTMEMSPNFDDQLKQVLSNIDGLLQSEGLKRTHIIKTTIFLTDLSQFAKVNQAYESYFQAPYPARSTVQISGLPKGSQVEIEVIAKKHA